MMKQKSFTLIELLVVIVIIGILAGVIMISTSSSIDKANIAKSKVFSESIKNELILNLVSVWNFDDSANPYKDSWGTNDCSLVVPIGVNAPELKTSNCVSGNCLYFFNVSINEPGSYLNCGSLVAATDVWTQELWIKSSENGRMPLTLGKASVYGSSGIAWSGNTWYPKLGNIYDDKWHHLVFTFSSDNLINGNNVFAFVDGKLVAQGNKGWSAVSSPLLIGKGYDWGGNDYPYKEHVDEIKIFNSHLSQAQIKKNYIAGLESLLSKGTISSSEFKENIAKMSSNR